MTISRRCKILFPVIAFNFIVSGDLILSGGFPTAWAAGPSQESTSNEATTTTTTSGIAANDPVSQRPSKQSGQLNSLPTMSNKLTHLPPMVAVRGLSDSPQIKKVLRSMITSQVPVMYQTMTMVENGAAAGFVGSMKTVSKLLNNVTNSAQLEIKLKQITDRSGAEALGYANAIHDGMKAQDPQKGSKLWPVGIFYASGDPLDADKLKAGQTISTEPIPHPDGGSTKLDAFKRNKSAGNNGTAKPAVASGSAPNGAGSSSEETLSGVLWADDNESMSQSFGSDKQFQEYIIGDLVIGKGSAKKDEPNSISDVSFRDPIHQVEDKNPPPGRTGPVYLKGFYYWKHKLKRQLWTNTYKLMGEYCQFKAQNGNRGKQIFEKETPASKITPEMIRNTSSQSFKWTVSLLDVFFKTWVETRSMDPNIPTKIDCDFEGQEDPEISMPDSPKEGDQKFDNCRADPKQCTRNRWILRLVDLIAEDRVIADFKNWHESAINRALGHHPWVAVRVEELMCTSLRSGRAVQIDPVIKDTAVVLCDSTMWLEGIAESNRQKWVGILSDLSNMAQNMVGSSPFTVQQNSIQNGPAGSVQSGGS